MQIFWEKIISNSLSVRESEALVRSAIKEKKIKKVRLNSRPIKAIEDKLVEILGTKVKLKPSQIGGAIEITYFSDDDLERILDLLQSL